MSELEKEILRRRAFAIIAHPDAGKTTLTEKLLLYGGAIQLAGQVKAKRDRKSTRSDWMALEQERGISISTTAMQFNYQGTVMNLLDTPGHEDFSEDTYRTLMAVDAAIMLIDGGKGVEPQTIKLFRICRERNLPIITFVNKMDLPAREPFELIDEIEKVLQLPAVPMVWPMGSGREFRGLYNPGDQKVYRYERTTGGMYQAPQSVSGLDDPAFASWMGESEYLRFTEDVAIISQVAPEFSASEFLAGKQTPVFFGSAGTNFGIDLLLENLVRLAPAPAPALLGNGDVLPPDFPEFTGFIFKLQANMNKAHRDRVAFMRIISGKFERGMSVNQPRTGRVVRLSSPVAFFGQDRNTIDEAFPGDIIGLINPHLYQIGDVLCTGTPPDFHPLPRFAPELFGRIVITDTAKLKNFRKGIQELAEEGVVQLFNVSDSQPLIGAVGSLQFEVFQYRLNDEYGVPVRIEPLTYEISRWFREGDRNKFGRFEKLVTDSAGNPVVLFESSYRLQSFEADNPDVPLYIHPPVLTRK